MQPVNKKVKLISNVSYSQKDISTAGTTVDISQTLEVQKGKDTTEDLSHRMKILTGLTIGTTIISTILAVPRIIVATTHILITTIMDILRAVFDFLIIEPILALFNLKPIENEAITFEGYLSQIDKMQDNFSDSFDKLLVPQEIIDSEEQYLGEKVIFKVDPLGGTNDLDPLSKDNITITGRLFYDTSLVGGVLRKIIEMKLPGLAEKASKSLKEHIQHEPDKVKTSLIGAYKNLGDQIDRTTAAKKRMQAETRQLTLAEQIARVVNSLNPNQTIGSA